MSSDEILGEPVTGPSTTYRLSYSVVSEFWVLAKDTGPSVAYFHDIAADNPDGVEVKANAWLRERGEVPLFWGRASDAPPTLYVQTREVNP